MSAGGTHEIFNGLKVAMAMPGPSDFMEITMLDSGTESWFSAPPSIKKSI